MANVIVSVGPASPAPALPVVGVGALPGAPPAAVAAVAPVTPASTAGSGGNRSPAGGDLLPAAVPAQPDVIQLTAAVAGVNRFLRDSQRQMLFEYDAHSGRESVTIINPATGEVIRQIPASQVLSTANSLREAGILLPGLFINERA